MFERTRVRSKIVSAFVLWIAAIPLQASTFTVTNTGDSGAGSLRQALLDANAHAGADTVNFDIKGGGVQTIAPLTALPVITSPVTINGYSQPGSSVNTSAIGTNAVLLIELSGASAKAAIGLSLASGAAPSTIRGLVINQFIGGSGNNGSGIVFSGTGNSAGAVQGCFIGTDVTGTVAAPNAKSGVVLLGGFVEQIGGALLADRNLISGNALHGIVLNTDGIAAQGNLIGTAADGLGQIGNGAHGIEIVSGSANLIGPGNVIAGNKGTGVLVAGSGIGNTITGNSIAHNTQLGIDLNPTINGQGDGASANDASDADNGPNNLQNFPVLTEALAGSGQLFVSGNLNSIASRTFHIEFFASDSADPSGLGEGQTFIGSIDRTTNANGAVSFTLVGVGPITTRQYVTATATDTVTGDTSEFSPGLVTLSDTTVSNTNDSGKGSLRDAILNANARMGAKVIDFAIPGAGVHVISPLTPLPTITETVTIDGYTQLGAVPNTLGDANNAVLKIQIDGANLSTSAEVLAVCAPNSLVRGLSVTGGPLDGVVFGASSSGQVCGSGSADGSQLAGSFVGVGPDGSPNGNGSFGVLLVGSKGTIGGSGPYERNVISANTGGSVALLDAADSVVAGNLIGWAPDGVTARGGFHGVSIGGSGGTTVGQANAPNRIGNNFVGIFASDSSAGNALFANSIGPNTGLGIDLAGDGVTPNDVDDADTGANDRQNYPVPNSVTRTSNGLHINASLDRPSGASALSYIIGVYSNSACDTSGHGEGQTFLGSFTFDSPNGSTETIDRNFVSAAEVPIGAQITLTATDANANTSEFSLCALVDAATKTYVVNTTADTDDGNCTASAGGCTLREAINAANAHAGGDTIGFAIPGAAVRVIAPTSALPAITEAVTINGYTQQGAAPNTLVEGDNANILIQLDGNNSDAPAALAVCANNTALRGLSITHWPAYAMLLGFDATFAVCPAGSASVIDGNFLGLTPDGSAAGNLAGAVFAPYRSARIGGRMPADRNVISANGTPSEYIGGAVLVAGGPIVGNYIGTDPSGTLARGNLGEGISTDGADITANRIAFNRNGIARGASYGSAILANEIFSNTGLGIDLIPSGVSLDGVTPNDPNDADSGTQGLQNFPIVSQTEEIGGLLTISGTLDVPAATSGAAYQIGVYWSPACDASGFGEGKVPLGTGTVSLSGNAEAFHFALPVLLVSGGVITTTATSPAGSTSEFSACSKLVAPPDNIFSGDFEF